jgi:hypothetical protein
MVINLLNNDSTTNSVELNKLGRKLFGRKWSGVYASDTFPTKSTGHSIVNLSTMASGGSHWISATKDGKFYDSLEQNGKLNDVEQSRFEKNCGQRAMAFLMLYEEDPLLAALL